MFIVKKTLDAVELLLKCVVTATLTAFTVLVAIQVVSRYAFHSPLPWSEQTARYLFIWMILLEMPVLFRNKGNMAFDLLLKRLPLGAQKFMGIVIALLIAAFAAVYFSAGYDLVVRSVGKTVAGLGIPRNTVYLAQPVGAGLLFIVALEQAADMITALFRKEGGKEQ